MLLSDEMALRQERYAWADQDAADRADEDAREQRWAEFLVWVRADLNHRHGALHWNSPRERMSELLADVMLAMRDHRGLPIGAPASPLMEFAETDGWPDVLAALSRALRDLERDAAEIERRR